MKQLSAPRIDYYLRWLGSINYRHVGHGLTYDERSYELLDELYHLLKQKLVPIRQRTEKTRGFELWFKAKRGPIEDFGDYEEYLEDETVENYDQFLTVWKDHYPDEEVWYHFSAFEDDYINYRAISVGREFVIELDPRKEKGHPNDISEFVEWILDQLKQCIHMLEAGTYNDMVTGELPPQHRTGTITRKALWDAYPERRESFFEPITKDDVQEFLAYAAAQPKNMENMTERLPHMTANDFFSFCALGYKANDYNGCELTPQAQYYKHADGRDEGLREIDPDSPDAFENWLLHRPDRFGGHPWEVCRGGNATHISLYVHHDELGYSLSIAGSAWTRTVETVKFYLALKRKGLPVFLYNARLLSDRLAETEVIGIVPKGIFPAYCKSMFPGNEVEDFMNLPNEEPEKLIPYCVWQEIPLVELV